MEVTEVQVIIVWLVIQDIFILEVGVLKVTVIQILVNHVLYISLKVQIFSSLFTFYLSPLFDYLGMRMASGSHMMSYNANPHSYQTSHVSRLGRYTFFVKSQHS